MGLWEEGGGPARRLGLEGPAATYCGERAMLIAGNDDENNGSDDERRHWLVVPLLVP